MNSRVITTLAQMARREPLRSLHRLCESQKQVSTAKLEDYLLCAGDELAGYAGILRDEFNNIAAAPAAPVVQADVQPVAWQARHTDDGVWMPCGQHYHDQIQADPQRFVGIESRPLYAAPPAHPDAALVEALRELLADTRKAFTEAIHWEDLQPVMRRIDAAMAAKDGD